MCCLSRQCVHTCFPAGRRDGVDEPPMLISDPAPRCVASDQTWKLPSDQETFSSAHRDVALAWCRNLACRIATKINSYANSTTTHAVVISIKCNFRFQHMR